MPNQYTGPNIKPLNVATRKNRHLLTVALTGCYYGECHKLAKTRDLAAGQFLYVVPHNDNSHDKFAIGVYVVDTDGVHSHNGTRVSRLGWISNKGLEDQTQKLLLWKMLTVGIRVEGKLMSLTTSVDDKINWANVEIKLAEEFA